MNFLLRHEPVLTFDIEKGDNRSRAWPIPLCGSQLLPPSAQGRLGVCEKRSICPTNSRRGGVSPSISSRLPRLARNKRGSPLIGTAMCSTLDASVRVFSTRKRLRGEIRVSAEVPASRERLTRGIFQPFQPISPSSHSGPRPKDWGSA